MATKKAVRKKSTTKKTSSNRSTSRAKKPKKTTQTATKSPSVQTDTKDTSTKNNKSESHKRFFIPLAIILIVGLVYAIATQFVVATVNYRPITRYTMLREMENQIGQQTLENLIVKQLILQEAQKQNIQVTTEEIDSEIATIEDTLSAQGQSIEEALAFQGLSIDNLRDQLKLQLTVNKLVGEQEVPEEEINEFIEQQSAFLQDGADESQIRQDAQEFLKQQKQAEAADELINNLRTQAQVNYFGPYAAASPSQQF